MPIDKSKIKSEITREQLKKALNCKTADELISLAKAEGYDITKDEAEAYLAEMADLELDRIQLEKIAGGMSDICWRLPCTDHIG